MLSEHTLKAIDIVCEEFDSEFKEQVTKHLQGFYKRMQRGYYSNQYGLCFNLQKMLSTEEIWLARACSAAFLLLVVLIVWAGLVFNVKYICKRLDKQEGV